MPPSATLTLPRVCKTAHEATAFVRAAQRAGKTVGFVPTMGALHAGHLSLVQRSTSECDVAVVSIFVNPTQFGPQEDFKKYPRDLEADRSKLAPLGVGLIFAPPVDEIYPPGFSTFVEVAGITKRWEGEYRPGHFRGVATVVLKLFEIVPANRAYFGRNDFQQLLTIERMVADLHLPIQVVGCPTVREPDGLAMSSRNAFLNPTERRHALALSRSLIRARELFVAGERNAAKIRDAVRQTVAAEPAVQVDYAAVVDPHTLEEITTIDSSAVVLLAAKVGATRLIDNEILGQNQNQL